jgi:2-iminobutanoate/2-iminopropanoate deaminase
MKIIGPPVIGPTGQKMPISGGVETNGLLFLAGQLSLQDGKLQGETAGEQLKVCFDNIERLLASEGLTLDNIAKATIWITDAEAFGEVNAEYSRRFAEPYPSRSVVISGLAVRGALVEIEVVASRAETRR